MHRDGLLAWLETLSYSLYSHGNSHPILFQKNMFWRSTQEEIVTLNCMKDSNFAIFGDRGNPGGYALKSWVGMCSRLNFPKAIPYLRPKWPKLVLHFWPKRLKTPTYKRLNWSERKKSTKQGVVGLVFALALIYAQPLKAFYAWPECGKALCTGTLAT